MYIIIPYSSFPTFGESFDKIVNGAHSLSLASMHCREYVQNLVSMQPIVYSACRVRQLLRKLIDLQNYGSTCSNSVLNGSCVVSICKSSTLSCLRCITVMKKIVYIQSRLLAYMQSTIIVQCRICCGVWGLNLLLVVFTFQIRLQPPIPPRDFFKSIVMC